MYMCAGLGYARGGETSQISSSEGETHPCPTSVQAAD